MSNRIFITSDTHFGHKRIIEFEKENRPFDSVEEHDKELVKRWNETVGPKDTVYHLGDVLFGADSFETLAQLNGIKKLIMGNHDSYPVERYLKYFSKVYGAHELRHCILTHIPVHPEQLDLRYKFNIHGHLHSDSIPDNRYVCVSMEHTGLKPILLDEVLEKANERIR